MSEIAEGFHFPASGKSPGAVVFSHALMWMQNGRTVPPAIPACSRCLSREPPPMA